MKHAPPPAFDQTSYIRADNDGDVLMVRVDDHQFVNEAFIGVQPGGATASARQLFAAQSDPVLVEYRHRSWPSGSIYWRTRWSRPMVYQDSSWPLNGSAQPEKSIRVFPAASDYDVENRRDEWRLHLMGRSRWQHEPIATGGRCYSAVIKKQTCGTCAACVNARRWHAPRVEASDKRDQHGRLMEQYSKQLSASDIKPTEIPSPHWRFLRGLKIPEGRDELVAKLEEHGNCSSWLWASTGAPGKLTALLLATADDGTPIPLGPMAPGETEVATPSRERRPAVAEARPCPVIGTISDRDCGFWLRDKYVAVGYPPRNPFRFDNSDWTNGPGFHGTEDDAGAAAVRKEEREFARSLRRRAKVVGVDWSEPEPEADDGAVAAWGKLEGAQLTIWAQAEADEVRRQAIEEAAGRLDDEDDLKLFSMTLDDRKQEEIAGVLGLSQSTVSRRLLQMRNALAGDA